MPGLRDILGACSIRDSLFSEVEHALDTYLSAARKTARLARAGQGKDFLAAKLTRAIEKRYQVAISEYRVHIQAHGCR